MLRNRKEQTEPKLVGVNRIADPTKLKLGTFQTLQNWIPAKRYKIKKKRGVEALVDSPPAPVIPTNCGVCAATVPEAQSLPAGCCYNSNGYGDLSNNNHGMLAYVASDGTFWHVATENTGFGSGPYPDATPAKTWYLLEPVDPTDTVDCLLQEATPLTLPGGRTANFESTQTPQGGTCGKSDEKLYILRLANISPTVDPGGGGQSSAWTIFGENVGVNFIFSSGNGIALGNAWCKFDDSFYAWESLGGVRYITRWPLGNQTTFESAHVALTSALSGWSDATFSTESIDMIHATDTYLYVLAHGPWSGGSSHHRIYQLNRSSLAYVQHWSLASDPDFSAAWGIHAFDDDLLFIITGQWKIGYFLTATGATSVIGTLAQTCTQAGTAGGTAGQHGFHYSKSYFYLSYSGFGIGSTNVLKIGPLLCPGQTSVLWDAP